MRRHGNLHGLARIDVPNDAQHRYIIKQEHNEIGAIFSGLNLRQIRRIDPRLGVLRQLDVQRVAQ